MLSAVATDRTGLESLARSSLGLDAGVRPADAIGFASLFLAWQSAAKRMETKNEMDAEAVASKVPKAVPSVEMQLFRAEFEKRFYKLKEAECPGKPSFEDLCEQIDSGELRPMALRHFGSRNEDDDAETGNIQVGKSGVLKIKKAKIETPAPGNLEEFRAKVMLMINHFIFARFRYPNKQILKDVNPFAGMEYLNYICSKDAFWTEVVEFSDGMGKKARLKLITELALGKLTGSPFVEVIEKVKGRQFAVGSFNTLKLCDRTGWSYCSTLSGVALLALKKQSGLNSPGRETPDVGSIFSISWCNDGTQLACGTGSGHVVFGSLVDRSCTWQNMDVTLDENNTITVVDILNETKEELDFRDRVTDMSLAHGALVVNTNSQCFVYQSTNWNTPENLACC
eukprot:g20850.t1